MRLWSLHPKYLDTRGLVALWREALLAQAVLKGKTRGYTRHPQLLRFRETLKPAHSIAEYLQTVYDEASRRGYHFDRAKIGRAGRSDPERMQVTRGQINYEWKHLLTKLAERAPLKLESLKTTRHIESNPVFQIVPGAVEAWEKTLL